MSPVQADDLWRQASARWAEIGAKRPDLAGAIDLQRSLVRLLLDARAALEAEPATGSDPFVRENTHLSRVLAKWQRGLPAFRNESAFIPELLEELLPAICSILAEGGAGEHALDLRQALTSGRIDPQSVLQVALARNHKAMRTSALHLGFSPDLLWLVGELGSSPVAYLRQHQLMRAPAIGAEASTWNRGYCPCCGSWPSLIEVANDVRCLRCSFCACAWELSDRRCVYCNNRDRLTSAALHADDSSRRLELCGVCANYTKVIESAAPVPFPLLAVEDLATMDLDEGAMQRGYVRPDLVDLDSIEPLISPSCT